MTAQDLGSFESECVQPISIDYRGWRVYGHCRTARAWPPSKCSISCRPVPLLSRGLCPRGDAPSHRVDEARLFRSAPLRCRPAVEPGTGQRALPFRGGRRTVGSATSADVRGSVSSLKRWYNS
jgi:hypothetical protein